MKIWRFLLLSTSLWSCVGVAEPFVYVVGGSTSSHHAVIDTATNQVVATFDAGTYARGSAISPAGSRLYITSPGSGQVDVVNVATNRLLASPPVPLGEGGPTLPASPTVVVDPSGSHVYVAAASVYKFISVINAGTSELSATISLADSPADLAFSPDGKLLYVLNATIDAISILDAASGSVVGNLAGRFSLLPSTMTLNHAGRKLYVAYPFQRDVIRPYPPARIVTEIDSLSGQAVDVDVGAQPFQVAVSGDDRRLYVATSAGVSVVDATTRTVLANIPISEDSRRRLALTPAGDRLYVTNSLSDSVTVLDTNSFGVVATIPFYFFPVSIAMGVPQKTVVEYFNPDLDNYFVTADAAEQKFVDTGAVGNWQRTGLSFKTSGPAKVCRFYGNTNVSPATGLIYGPNSHFYTAAGSECDGLKSMFNPNAPSWRLESLDFQIAVPDSTGACPAGTVPVYRAYDNSPCVGQSSACKPQPNHRLTIRADAIAEVVTRGWTAEGVAMCALE